MKTIKGDLIKLALQGEFDIIMHGCNCFCVQKSGIARQMVEHFKTNDRDLYKKESKIFSGVRLKLGTIEGHQHIVKTETDSGRYTTIGIKVYNAYTQYYHARNAPQGLTVYLDYGALRSCLKDLKHRVTNSFKTQRIGLPKIGCGLAGGDWNTVKRIIEQELQGLDVTIVEYEK